MSISESPSLAEVVTHGIDSRMAELFKALPGIVTAYDELTSTAFVKPATKHARYSTDTGERSFLEMSGIPFVPVLFPRAGDFVMRMPVNVGDTVLLVFNDSALSAWHESGGVSASEDARRHSCGYPVAIPGFFPACKPMSPVDAAAVALGQAIFGEDGGRQLRIGPTGIELAPAGVTPVMPLALAPPVLTAFAAIATYIAAMTTALATQPDHLMFAAAMAAPGATLATALGGLAATVPSTLVRAV